MFQFVPNEKQVCVDDFVFSYAYKHLNEIIFCSNRLRRPIDF